ncbi:MULTISPECIES: plasmid pRiA4b ORF-3 family protein [Bradyrhizobium]|uniref:plasmid pRiA4b ORF-3 family protein n=1 Tax=Bradyrhizobium TaxID=374 RepID=UPI0009EA8CB6|nr:MULTISPECIES: plasmid pRiA4b ORF-3 family protein [Bradyrhizobium]
MRRLVVPVTLRLDRLHLTLQAAFGWTNSHLFEFFAGEVRWGIPGPHKDYGHQPLDASKARLCDIVQETGAKTIHYFYHGSTHVVLPSSLKFTDHPVAPSSP